MRRAFFAAAALFFSCGLVPGCGYTTKSSLPEHVKSVYVAPIKNVIDLSSEISDKHPLRVYRPGIEVDLTNAVINRFIFDGTLKVTPPERADAVLEAKLRDYRRDPLRYSDSDDVQEYRLSVVLDVAVYESRTRKILWHEQNLTADTTYFLSGPHALSEDEAAAKVVDDAAQRIVEATVELW